MERIRCGARRGGARRAAVATVSVLAAVLGSGRLVDAGADEPRATAGHTDHETDALRHLVAKSAQSMDRADSALATQLWAQSPDVSFGHPRGHERGWDQVKTNVDDQLMAATFAERKLTPRDGVVHVDGEAAWAEFAGDFVAKLRSDGPTLTTKGPRDAD